MKSVFITLATCALLAVPSLQDTEPASGEPRGANLDVHVNVPADWKRTGHIRFTKGDNYRMTGRPMEADSSEVVQLLDSYIHQRLDSTLLPAFEAYDISYLLIRVEGNKNAYERWLCARGKRSFWQSEPFIHHPSDSGRVIEVTTLDADDPRNVLPDWFAVELETGSGSAPVNTRSQAYARADDDRCYEIVLSGSALLFDQNRDRYREIVSSVRFGE